MSETLTLRVTETVEHVHTVELTDELLDEAASWGEDRTLAGVLAMLTDDPDHDAVLAVADGTHFVAVRDREVEEA